MMMVVDVSSVQEPFDDIATQIEDMGRDRIGVVIKMQLEEIFTMMHRI